jgi:hypothetical protein
MDKEQLISEIQRQAALQDTPADQLRYRAAAMLISGDIAAAQNAIAAAMVPESEWQAAKAGTLDY